MLEVLELLEEEEGPEPGVWGLRAGVAERERPTQITRTKRVKERIILKNDAHDRGGGRQARGQELSTVVQLERKDLTVNVGRIR